MDYKKVLDCDHEFFVKKIESLKTLKSLRNLILKIVFLILFVFFVLSNIFGMYRMKGISMVPSLNDGDLVFYYKLDKDYHFGDTVCFQYQNREYVLRVIGKSGDVIDIKEDGYLYVNNHIETDILYFDTTIPDDTSIEFPYKVPENHLFLVGDNRTSFDDSRLFGSVSTDTILGKVICFLRTKKI